MSGNPEQTVVMALNVSSHTPEWVTAEIEDRDGNRLASVTAPLMEGATFDTRGAVIRAAVEEAIAELNEEATHA